MAKKQQTPEPPSPLSSKLSDIVQPSVRVAGEQHLLQKIFDGDPDKLPLITAVGYMPIGRGPNSWISYTIKTKGKDVLSIEVDEPNLRDIAEESAKIAFVSSFIDHESF